MTNPITHSDTPFVISESMIISLLQMNRDMKIKVIALLSNSLCDNETKDDVSKDKVTDFPVLPKDFKVSDSIKSMGKKFPDDFNFDAAIDEMYNQFAR